MAAAGLPLELYFARSIKLLQRVLNEVKRLKLHPKLATSDIDDKVKANEAAKKKKAAAAAVGVSLSPSASKRKRSAEGGVDEEGAAAVATPRSREWEPPTAPSVFVGYHGVRWRVISSDAASADDGGAGQFDGLTLQWLNDPEDERPSPSAEASAGSEGGGASAGAGGGSAAGGSGSGSASGSGAVVEAISAQVAAARNAFAASEGARNAIAARMDAFAARNGIVRMPEPEPVPGEEPMDADPQRLPLTPLP